MKTAKIISESIYAKDVKIYLEDVDGKSVDISDYVMDCKIRITPGEINEAILTLPLEFELSVEVKDIIQVSTMTTRPNCPYCRRPSLRGNCISLPSGNHETICEKCGRAVFLDETLFELAEGYEDYEDRS